MSQPLKSYLRAPEGKWVATSERRATTNFLPDLPVVLSFAQLPDGGLTEPTQLLLFTTQHFLYICHPQSLDREPLRIIDFRHLATGGVPVFPTCHAHTREAKDDYDLAVGLNTGEVMLLSLRAQLRAPASSTRPASSLSYNPDGSANSSRCVTVAWVPGTNGAGLVAAHRDGGVLAYHKVVGSSSDTKLLARSSSQGALKPPISQLQGAGTGGGVHAAAVSPDGQHVAVACRDGVLRIYAYPAGGLVAGFKSYYGGLLCCCWSPDGRYVAAGGEDDMVALYGLAERCVVAYCQGHTSWVSGVVFDPWMCHVESEAAGSGSGGQQTAAAAAAGNGNGNGGDSSEGPSVGPDRVYRLATVGQDCQLAVWDVVVSEEAVVAAQQASSANTSPERGKLPPSPSKRSFAGFRQRGSSAAPSGPAAAAAAAAEALTAAGVIAPPLPRADWPLFTPVVQQRAHPEPACSALFTANALFTACHGSSVRRWARPLLTQQAVVRRIDSLQSLQGERQERQER